VISGQTRPGQVIISISDQGPGIDPADIPFVFDRFYRSQSAARNTKGAGLGLYLAKAIVEAHGGRIWLDPNPNSGARIFFSLPRSRD
jgi:signal transduction histidine kinase